MARSPASGGRSAARLRSGCRSQRRWPASRSACHCPRCTLWWPRWSAPVVTVPRLRKRSLARPAPPDSRLRAGSATTPPAPVRRSSWSWRCCWCPPCCCWSRRPWRRRCSMAARTPCRSKSRFSGTALAGDDQMERAVGHPGARAVARDHAHAVGVVRHRPDRDLAGRGDASFWMSQLREVRAIAHVGIEDDLALTLAGLRRRGGAAAADEPATGRYDCVSGQPVCCSGAVDLAELGGVELARVKRPLLDRATAKAVSLGLVATQSSILEVAVPDRAVDDVLGADRCGRVRHAAQRDKEREAGDGQCG